MRSKLLLWIPLKEPKKSEDGTIHPYNTHEKREITRMEESSRRQIMSHARWLIHYLLEQHMIEDYVNKYIHITDDKVRAQFIDWIKWHINDVFIGRSDKSILYDVNSYEYHISQRASMSQWSEWTKKNMAYVLHGKLDIKVPSLAPELFNDSQDEEIIEG